MKPGWVDSLPVGQWIRISGNCPDLGLTATPPGTRYLEDNDPATDPALNHPHNLKEWARRVAGKRPCPPWHGCCGFSSITEAWNSAVFASRLGRSGSMVVFGGGHNDYFGSDMHAFDLDTRQWSRVSDGYVSSDTANYGQGAVYPNAEYPDGSPLPPHTYDYVQYSPDSNDYVLFKGQIELGPRVRAIAIPHMFNFDTLSWRRGPMHPTAVLNSGGFTAWDVNRRKMWGHSGDAGGGNAFLSFDPTGSNSDGSFGQWGETFPNKLEGEADHNAMAVDPERDVIAVLVHARNELYMIDPAQPEAPIAQLRSSAAKPVIHEYAALEYAPNIHGFVYYSATDGAKLYKVSPPSGQDFVSLANGEWTWESLLDNESSLDPISDAANKSKHETNRSHTFGRFRIASYGDVDTAILVRHVDSPVYALRIT